MAPYTKSFLKRTLGNKPDNRVIFCMAEGTVTETGFLRDLFSKNAFFDKRDINLWNKHKPIMQGLTDKIRNNVQSKYGVDMLKEGLSGNAAQRVAAVDHMTTELAKELGGDYDLDDVSEYARQYFNLTPEQYEDLAAKMDSEIEELRGY